MSRVLHSTHASFRLEYIQRLVALFSEEALAGAWGRIGASTVRKSPLPYDCGFLGSPTISFARSRALIAVKAPAPSVATRRRGVGPRVRLASVPWGCERAEKGRAAASW